MWIYIFFLHSDLWMCNFMKIVVPWAGIACLSKYFQAGKFFTVKSPVLIATDPFVDSQVAGNPVKFL